jgi:hypothetical protein
VSWRAICSDHIVLTKDQAATTSVTNTWPHRLHTQQLQLAAAAAALPGQYMCASFSTVKSMLAGVECAQSIVENDSTCPICEHLFSKK